MAGQRMMRGETILRKKIIPLCSASCAGAMNGGMSGMYRGLTARCLVLGITVVSICLAPQTAAAASLARPVPILMYHEVGDGPNELYVRTADLEAQLRYLKDEGYEFLSLGAASQVMAGKSESRGKVVALTFDDGYSSHYDVVFPMLKDLGVTATFFVITGKVGEPGYLTWEQVRTMADAGMEIGSHSVTHCDLARASQGTIRREIAGSKAALEAALERPVTYFCYPAGKTTRLLPSVLEKAGYAGAVTTAPGWAYAVRGRYMMRRVRVSRSDTMEMFRKRLENPWVYGG